MLDLDRIPEAVRSENGISRRLFVGFLGSLAAIPLIGERAALAQTAGRTAFSTDPFGLGVASGDPDSSSVVLWTKLAPDLTLPDAGMGDRVVNVSWEVAEDEGMKKVVQKGTAVASKELGHSVHAEVSGLRPDRWYFYRFRAGDAESPVGRTRTLPEASVMPEQLRFAFASCQHYEAGLYTAYQHMAEDELDLIFHLGDYIYEAAPGKKGSGVRRHSPTEAGGPLMTLTDYRLRHAQYKSDKHLQAAHARCPWWVTWDDHEVSNNYADDIDGKVGLSISQFLKRRAAAYQAYYEMMPLRARSMPKGPNLQLYRAASFGRLADLTILDTRQFRTDQPNNDRAAPLNEAAMSDHQTIMGKTQKAWLKDRLKASRGTWNVIAQQVMMGMLKEHAADEPNEDVYNMDAWSGYAHERMEIVKYMQDARVSNPVVLTGDVHANYVNDLRVDDREADKPIVAAEFVGTSIASGGDGEDQPKGVGRLLSDNPGLRYHNRERGYVRCTLTPKLWNTDYVTVAKVTEANADAKVREVRRRSRPAGHPEGVKRRRVSSVLCANLTISNSHLYGR
ncbi:MAG: alkaline phosphatase D family protein [Tepidisphaeraceae bacterium]